MDYDLTPAQRALVDAPLDAKIFLRGRAGAGKTSAAIQRSLHLLTSGLPAESVLILTPQRTLQTAYEEAILAAGCLKDVAVPDRSRHDPDRPLLPQAVEPEVRHPERIGVRVDEADLRAASGILVDRPLLFFEE